jgi:hypothetical protein
MPCLAFFLSPGCGPVIIGTANMLIADVWLLNRVSGLDKALYGGEGVRLRLTRQVPENTARRSTIPRFPAINFLCSTGEHR